MILSAENDVLFDPRFDDLQKIVSSVRSQFADKPLIKYQKIDFLVCLDDLSEFPIRSRNRKLVKQFGKSYVTDSLKLAAGSISESTGNVGLSVSGRSFENNVPAFVYVVAGRKAQHFAFVKVPVLNVFNSLDRCVSIGEMGVPDVSDELVVLSADPFGIYQQCQTIFKSKLLVAFGIFKLTFQLTRKSIHFHRSQTFYRAVCHLPSPPFFQ